MARSHHCFELREEPGLGVPVVHVAGEVDLMSARELEALVREALQQPQGPQGPQAGAGTTAAGLALDLREVTYLDAMGIQALLNANRMARRHGRRLVLLDRVRPLRRELAACQVHRLVPIFPTPEHAREAFPLGDASDE